MFLDYYKYDKRSSLFNSCGSFDVAPFAAEISCRVRKYSQEMIHMALHGIVNEGLTVTQASINFGIKRTSLQHYLKQLKINKGID